MLSSGYPPDDTPIIGGSLHSEIVVVGKIDAISHNISNISQHDYHITHLLPRYQYADPPVFGVSSGR